MSEKHIQLSDLLVIDDNEIFEDLCNALDTPVESAPTTEKDSQ